MLEPNKIPLEPKKAIDGMQGVLCRLDTVVKISVGFPTKCMDGSVEAVERRAAGTPGAAQQHLTLELVSKPTTLFGHASCPIMITLPSGLLLAARFGQSDLWP